MTVEGALHGCVVALALVACGTKRGAGEQRPAAGDGPGQVGAAGCTADPEPCPGSCNAQGYCEQDLGSGAEIRLPATRYVVDYRGRMGNMTEYSLYEFPTAFWVDKRELTNRLARQCATCGAGVSALPADELPAQVTRGEAMALCAAAGKRLPTNAEWEAAARGPSPCTDPAALRTRDPYCNTRVNVWNTGSPDDYADTFCEHALIADCGSPTGPRVVEDRPKGASPVGAQEMIGNVSEWIADMEGDEGMVKGGDWTTPGDEGMYSYVSIGARAREKVDRRFGVRCVRGPVMDVKPRLKAGPWGPAQ
jgi:hypothetical protein